MNELDLTQDELADLCNNALLTITGRPGDISSRTIRNLLNGTTRRPIGRTCVALEHVFGCPVTELGFSAPSTMRHPPEVPVHRREFIVTSGAAVASPIHRQPRSVSMTDVARVSADLDKLIEADDHRGGNYSLASAASEGRGKVLGLQQRNASESVRRALYALAAEYTSIAAWACIDMNEPDAAQAHLHEATTHAGLSQDPVTAMRVWINVAMLASQRKNWPEKLAAAQAASTSKAARRDPFFGSMARVHIALAQSSMRETRAAEKALSSAQESLAKSQTGTRPRWTAFYGPAELDHLAAIIFNRNGEPAKAEAMAHRALARMPGSFQRNRALVTCQLALAQVRQGEPEQATETAADVFQIMQHGQLPGRMRALVGAFHRDLLRLAPSTACARDWADRTREEWSQG
ncbi:XRE family transcriptional regulator [Streptomyces sp. NPDC002454]